MESHPQRVILTVFASLILSLDNYWGSILNSATTDFFFTVIQSFDVVSSELLAAPLREPQVLTVN
jgi:hypothetical protein